MLSRGSNADRVASSFQGYEQQVLVFNGSIPGPTISADWGDDGK